METEIVKILLLSCFYFEMFHRPGIAVLLVAVATRMSLCLSLFSPLLLVLRWRRHREPIGKKQIWRFGRRALREVPTSPSAVAVSRGWRLGEASHWAVKSIRCRNSENRLSKFDRGEEEWEEDEEEVGGKHVALFPPDFHNKTLQLGQPGEPPRRTPYVK